MSIHIEKDLQELLRVVEEIENSVHTLKKISDSQDTELYWIGARMQNNRVKFKEIDIKNIDRLQQKMEVLLDVQNKIVKLAENICFDVKEVIKWKKEVKQDDEQQGTLITRVGGINEKFSLLQKLLKNK